LRFFFTDTAPTCTYSLSLHDALPISVHRRNHRCAVGTFTPNDGGNHRQAHPLVSTYTIAVNTLRASAGARPPPCGRSPACGISRSEEHTSELQSRENLVCRLLLEKKK